MTAATLIHHRPVYDGIRPVNPRRDMGEIADLIQEAFGKEMDPNGSRLVRDMKAFSRAGFFGWFFGRFFLPQAAYPMGYVWQEGGRVVGNASLIRVDGFPQRWVMANVAVDPAFRRRGIGRNLIRASMDLAERKKALELLLQVLSSNQVALDLYTSLNFKPLSTRTTWSRSPKKGILGSVDTGASRMRTEGEWKDQFALAERIHPEGLIWPYPLTSSIFDIWNLSRVYFQEKGRHWVWFEGGRLLGSLTARYTLEHSTLRFILLVDPEARGEIEAPLVSAGLMAFAHRNMQIMMDYPAGYASQEFEKLGFLPERTLTWMMKQLNQSV